MFERHPHVVSKGLFSQASFHVDVLYSDLLLFYRGKKWDVDLAKIYNKTQREKFAWAIDMAEEDYRF